jgi:SOS-response transcriptional repressor LexA
MSANRCARQPATLEPTRVQLTCLHLIEQHRKDRGHAPTIREMCGLRGVASTNGTAECLKALVKKGLLSGEPHLARTLRATPKGAAFLSGFKPSGPSKPHGSEPTGDAVCRVKTASQAVNNAAAGEG